MGSELRQREGMAARALEFKILTAARSGEVRGATWSEMDLEAGIWTVPASFGMDRVVPPLAHNHRRRSLTARHSTSPHLPAQSADLACLAALQGGQAGEVGNQPQERLDAGA